MKNARTRILQDFKDESTCSQALRYFSKVTLHGALPVFPALLSMAAEVVGGAPQETTLFGEALVFISASADLHDDVIDKSLQKGAKQTVLGKFGESVTILAGDILLVEGLRRLHEASEVIPKANSREIMRLISMAVSEISNGEVLETQLRTKKNLTPAEFHEVIRLKAVVPEVSMKIGALANKGNNRDVENLGQFGRIYGINSILIEEFVDLLDIQELNSRLKNECPPLPIIYALQDPRIKTDLISMLTHDLDESDHKKLVDMVLESKEIIAIHNILTQNAKNEQLKLKETIKGNIGEELTDLLLVPLQSLEI